MIRLVLSDGAVEVFDGLDERKPEHLESFKNAIVFRVLLEDNHRVLADADVFRVTNIESSSAGHLNAKRPKGFGVNVFENFFVGHNLRPPTLG